MACGVRPVDFSGPVKTRDREEEEVVAGECPEWFGAGLGLGVKRPGSGWGVWRARSV